MDPRVERTRAALCQAFEELVVEKSFDKVTVREICESAGLSRSASYDNYHDKFDLAKDAMRRVFRSFDAYEEGAFEECTVTMLSLIRKNRIVRNSLAISGLGGEIQATMNDLFVEATRYLVDKGVWRQRSTLISLESALAFVSQGLAGVVSSWARAGCRRNEREMAQEMVLLASSIFELER